MVTKVVLRGAMPDRAGGFTLAEVLLAFGLAAVALLALVAQSTLLVSSNQKADNSTVAADVAQSALERLAIQIRRDQPSGIRAQAFAQDSAVSPFRQGTERVGHTDYDWQIFVSDVNDTASGAPVGTGTDGTGTFTRLKRLDVEVTWWDQSNNERQGMGKLEVKSTRLLKVVNET